MVLHKIQHTNQKIFFRKQVLSSINCRK